MCFIFNHTEQVSNTILVEFYDFKLFVSIHYGRKIGRNCSKLGSNCPILINPAKKIFRNENLYIFSNVNFYCIKVSTLIRTHCHVGQILQLGRQNMVNAILQT